MYSSFYILITNFIFYFFLVHVDSNQKPPENKVRAKNHKLFKLNDKLYHFTQGYIYFITWRFRNHFELIINSQFFAKNCILQYLIFIFKSAILYSFIVSSTNPDTDSYCHYRHCVSTYFLLEEEKVMFNFSII